jgi:cell division transport system permease protein
MKIWLSHHRLALGLATGKLFGSPFASFLTLLVMGIALSLPASLYVALTNLDQLSGNISNENQISLYLNLSVTPEQTQDIRQKLAHESDVKDYKFIGRDAALKDLSASTGLDDITSSLGKNPLPDAFHVRPKTNNPDTLDALRAKMEKWPGVYKAKLDSAWARRLAAILDLGKHLVWLLGFLLSLGLVAININTIRLQIANQRDEIEVSKLIGATNAFIRRPFLYVGTIQGLAAGFAAWGIVSSAVIFLNQKVAQLAALYASNFSLQPLNINDSMGLVLIAAGLGWLGAYLSSSYHIRRI